MTTWIFHFDMTSKTCFKCKQEKPLSEFYSHPQMPDGHLGKCKSCTKIDVKVNREKHRDYYAEYERLRFKTERRKKTAEQSRKKHRQKHPEKYKARCAVGNAIRDGRLKRQPCSICGNPKAQAHHHDYNKPFEVDWLCFKHHRELAHGQTVIAN